MNETKKAPEDDILSCPKCGGKAMFIYIEENEVQSVRCSSCNDLVGYTEKLIRVLGKV